MPVADLARLLRRRRAGPSGAFADKALDFEAFGYHCEFGMVQRHVGAEPLGLFRFTFCTTSQLARALDDRLVPYGRADDLEIISDAVGHLVCRSRTYGFSHIALTPDQDGDAASCLRRETQKIAYLKQRLIETLTDGQKIIVRRSPPGEERAELEPLLRAIRRYGPSPILIVKPADPAAPAAGVRSLGERVFETAVPHFAQRPGQHFRMDLEAWLQVCQTTHALVHGEGKAWRPLRRLASRRRAERHLVGHGARPNAAGVEVFGRQQRTAWFTPGAVHTFSAWVYIPSSFEGDRVGAALAHYRRGWRDADLELRDTWQRIWVSAEIPAEHARIVVGLVVSGREGGTIWSLGWEIEERDVPTPGPAPAFIPA